MQDEPRPVAPAGPHIPKTRALRLDDLIFFKPGARRFVVIGAIAISLLVFFIALFLPAYQLSNGDTFSALSAFLLGWLGVFYPPGGLGWYANVFLPITWIGWAFSKFRLSLAATVAGIGLALCSGLLKTILLNESGDKAQITALGSGFYVWLGSFGICLAAGLALLGTDLLRRSPSP